MTLSPDALAQADVLDKERAAGRLRGPLHGIPFAVKDTLMVANMQFTNGAVAMKGTIPPFEATVVANLRSAGAVIIATTTTVLPLSQEAHAPRELRLAG